MGTSTTKIRRRMRTLEARRRTLLRRLSGLEELAVGSVSWIDRKCGGPGCHCAQGPGHRQLQFLFADADGTRRCKLVRKADEARLETANRRYRRFRDDLRELATIQNQQRALLVALMRARGLTYR